MRISCFGLKGAAIKQKLKKQKLWLKAEMIRAQPGRSISRWKTSAELHREIARAGCNDRELQAGLHVADASSAGDGGLAGVGNKHRLNPAERNLDKRRKAFARRIFAKQIQFLKIE